MTTTILPQVRTILSRGRSLKISISRSGRVEASRAYIIDMGESAPTKMTVNLPNMMLVDGGELSPDQGSPQSALRFKFLANS
ncbi:MULTISPECIES: hypothetical protein [unclassified Microcoleus]|uniref:hypothetical protein n=1 Tax=unclassified Microcoleus TaxID=2642155 RepID=UPI002FD27F8C